MNSRSPNETGKKSPQAQGTLGHSKNLRFIPAIAGSDVSVPAEPPSGDETVSHEIHSELHIRTTDEFKRWLTHLRDTQAKGRITAAIRRCEVHGRMLGVLKQLDSNLYEIKFMFGPGYRVYYTQQGKTVVLLLVGGDKSTQQRDVDKARELVQELNEEEQQW